MLSALGELAAAGHDVEWVEVADPELAIEGLVSGRDIQFAAQTANAALIAIQQGAPIKLVGDAVGYGHAVFASTDIVECADLEGRRVGVHSAAAVGTAVLKYWINKTCPGVEPEYLIIGGADVRYLALTSGEIDATLLPLVEVIQLEAEQPGAFNRLANLGEEIQDIRPAPIYGNAPWMEANRAATELFFEVMAEEYDKVNADPQYLVDITAEYWPEALPEGLELEIATQYVEGGLFDLTALTPETMQSTIDFFEENGVTQPGLTVEDVADFSYLDAVMSRR